VVVIRCVRHKLRSYAGVCCNRLMVIQKVDCVGGRQACGGVQIGNPARVSESETSANKDRIDSRGERQASKVAEGGKQDSRGRQARATEGGKQARQQREASKQGGSRGRQARQQREASKAAEGGKQGSRGRQASKAAEGPGRPGRQTRQQRDASKQGSRGRQAR
jgi:hypothetical protein